MMITCTFRSSRLSKLKLNQAMNTIEQASQRDPFPPDGLWDVYAMIACSLGRYGDAIAAYHRMGELPPWGFGFLAIAHGGLGQMAEARANAALYLQRSRRKSVDGFFRGDPFQEPEVLARFRKHLIDAGMPEHDPET